MKYVFNIVKRIVYVILLIIVVYLSSSIFLSIIPVNKDFQEESDSPYEVWIKSNGVHLDIVLPVKNNNLDWNDALVIPDDIKGEVKFVGFGWGDKDFYINTPEWSDLRISTAFRALFVRTDAAMHVRYYKKLSENEMTIKLLVNEQQFKEVQSYVLKSFKMIENNAVLIENVKYGSYDSFYDANYAYSLFFTCNTWTNEALKKSGLPANVWTPFDKGILYRLRNINQD